MWLSSPAMRRLGATAARAPFVPLAPGAALLSRGLRTWDTLPRTPAPNIPKEYKQPKVVTLSVPGPQSKLLASKMEAYQDARPVHFFVDLKKSRGNYVVDADSNIFLDMYAHIASLPIGYNHPDMINAALSKRWTHLLTQRPALGVMPNMDWVESLESIMAQAAPPGLKQVVTTCGCGSSANENAYKAVFMWYCDKNRRGAPFSQEELSSCMLNQAPGSPNLSILSFEKAFHGRTFGCLSTTRSKPIHKLDIPAFDWPVAPFPKLKYPLEENVEHNRAEETRCLKAVEELIRSYHVPVAGVVVEPIQAEGGDNYATPFFFQGLRDITKKLGVALIVDEVQTGVGATGTFWAHEQWGLSSPPDIVTFAKKMQVSGYYHLPEFRAPQTYRIFNTWMGDPLRMMQFETIFNVIKRDQLLENTVITGNMLREGLLSLSKDFPELVQNVRGMGTFLAFDAPSAEVRDNLVSRLRVAGIQTGGCGELSFRLRPALILQPRHAAQYLDVLYQTFSQYTSVKTAFDEFTEGSPLETDPAVEIRNLLPTGNQESSATPRA